MQDRIITMLPEMGITLKRGRGRPQGTFKKPQHREPEVIDFTNRLGRLDNLDIDPRMLETMRSGLKLDNLISHDVGMPCATNIMFVGDPGIGKTTVLLDYLSAIQLKEGRKCLFISGEMGKKQMFKYTQRFPQFGVITTLFTSDFGDHNSKDTIEQVMNLGWDLVLIDSLAEVIDDVREDMEWSRKEAESWLVDVCEQNNQGDNDEEKFTTFMLIQQVTKGGVFVGSNKLKHLTDATCELRRHAQKDGGGSYIKFTKNRNGNVGDEMPFDIGSRVINYGVVRTVDETLTGDKEIPFIIIEPEEEKD